LDFNFGNSRERVVQPVLMFNRIVPAAPATAIPVSEDIDQHKLVTSFMVNNYANAPGPVYLGVSSSMHSSVEILPGAAPVFTVFQEGRQFYELQILIMKIASQTAQDLIKIPVITWDLTTWFLESSTPQPIPVTVVAFPVPYL